MASLLDCDIVCLGKWVRQKWQNLNQTRASSCPLSQGSLTYSPFRFWGRRSGHFRFSARVFRCDGNCFTSASITICPRALVIFRAWRSHIKAFRSPLVIDAAVHPCIEKRIVHALQNIQPMVHAVDKSLEFKGEYFLSETYWSNLHGHKEQERKAQ